MSRSGQKSWASVAQGLASGAEGGKSLNLVSPQPVRSFASPASPAAPAEPPSASSHISSSAASSTSISSASSSVSSSAFSSSSAASSASPTALAASSHSLKDDVTSQQSYTAALLNLHQDDPPDKLQQQMDWNNYAEEPYQGQREGQDGQEEDCEGLESPQDQEYNKEGRGPEEPKEDGWRGQGGRKGYEDDWQRSEESQDEEEGWRGLVEDMSSATLQSKAGNASSAGGSSSVGNSTSRSGDEEVAAEAPAPSALLEEKKFQLVCNQDKHRVEGIFTVKLAENDEFMSVIFTTGFKSYEGVLKAEGTIDPSDIREASESFRGGNVIVHMDKLRVTGVGFQVKLKEMADRPPASADSSNEASIQEELAKVEASVARLRQAISSVARPLSHTVSPEELQSYGWFVDAATKYRPDGKIPDDDLCWRGSYNGQVRAFYVCGQVVLEGQVSGVGPGMRTHSERRVAQNQLFSEVSFPVFRLPREFRPRRVESFSRRALEAGALSSDFIGGFANGYIGYRPVRRLDVLPDGLVVIVCCLHVETELQKVLRRPSRWIVDLKSVKFFV